MKVNGFHIQNPSSPNTQACVSITVNSTDYYITNNNMYACDQFVKEASTGGNTTYGFIRGNTMSWSDTTSTAPLAQFGGVGRAGTVNGDHHLIENNDISHVSDGIYFSGAYNVIRKNTFHDVYTSDCLIRGNGGNCHIDFMQADANCSRQVQPQYGIQHGGR